MSFIKKDLYATHDWRGEKAPSLSHARLDWHTPVPSLTGKVILLEFWATWCGVSYNQMRDGRQRGIGVTKRVRDRVVEYKEEYCLIREVDRHPDVKHSVSDTKRQEEEKRGSKGGEWC